MRKSIFIRQTAGFVFTSISGTLLHFLYEWTNGNFLAAFISGVNESTWEHMKILFFPLFFFALIQSRILKDKPPCFWCVKLSGTLTGLILIPVLFYTYNGIFGRSPDFVNIAIYYISAAATFILETRLFKKGKPCGSPAAALIVLYVIAFLFVLFTFFTPQLPIFKDPLTKLYGI